MLFESPKKHQPKHSNDNCSYNDNGHHYLQLTPTLNVQESSSVVKIFFYYKKSRLAVPYSEQAKQSLTTLSSPCRNEIGQRSAAHTESISKRLQLSSSLSKIYEVSINHSCLKSKLIFIYNQYSKKSSNWVDSFEAFCFKEGIDLSEVRRNSPIKTYSQKQSFINSNELFWLLAINYIHKVKKFFSFEDLVNLTHIAIDSVKNSVFILNKCYLPLAKQFKCKERINYCIKKSISQIHNEDYLKLLNDDRHMITKENGAMITTKNKRNKRAKLLSDINQVSISDSHQQIVNPFVSDY